MHEITAGAAAGAVFTALAAAAGFFFFKKPEFKSYILAAGPWLAAGILIIAGLYFKKGVNNFGAGEITVSAAGFGLLAFAFILSERGE